MPPINTFTKTALTFAVSQALMTSSHAATIEVNNSGDTGVGCTLRDAINSFNSQSLAEGCIYDSGNLVEPGTITFANSLANSTIALNGS